MLCFRTYWQCVTKQRCVPTGVKPSLSCTRLYEDKTRNHTCHVLLLLLLLLLTAIELSLDGSTPRTSTDKTNKNKYTQTTQYKQRSTINTKHRKYKYTYYQNTHTLQKPHTHTLQNKLKQPQYKIHPNEIVTI